MSLPSDVQRTPRVQPTPADRDLRQLRARLDQLRRLSDLANRGNVNAGYSPGMPTPIPAQCTNPKCAFHWTGRDAIRAHSLANVRCFWCQSELRLLGGGPAQGDLFARRSA